MRYLLVVVWCCFVCSILAQQPHFRNYTVEQGLPSSECYQLLQDRQGFIWIATDKGLSRFDGYKFQNFTTRNGLPENCVLKMYLDPRGRIWFVCLSGKMAIYENGRLKPLPINPQLVRKMEGGVINSICMYGDTLRLAYVSSNKALEIVHKGKSFRLLNYHRKLRAAAFTEIFPNDEIVYGWVIFNRKQHSSPSFDVHIGKKRKIFTDVFSSCSAFWFRSLYLNKKLYLINDEKLSVLSLKNMSKHTVAFDSRLLAIKTERSGKDTAMWIGAMNGLFCFKDIKNLKDPVISLRGKSVTDMYWDKEGGLWVTTMNNGVYYAKNMRVRNFLSGRKVFTLLKNNNALILGLDHSRIGILDTKGMKEYQLVNDGMGYPVHSIFRVDDDQLIVCRSRLSVFSLKKKQVTRTSTMPAARSFTYNPVTRHMLLYERGSITEFSADTIISRWLLSGYGLRLDCATILKNGRILLGTNRGLGEYIVDKNRVDIINKKIPDLTYIMESGRAIWMCSREHGVLIERKGKLHNITVDSGLTSNYCRHIYMENPTTAWLSTNKGLTCVKILSWQPFRYKCSRFSSKEGLISDELTGVCEWNNYLVVAGSKGLSMLEKSKMYMPEYKPAVYLSDLMVNGKQLPLRTRYNLDGKINNLVISFRGLCFRKEGHLLYRYRLVGADNNWNTTTNTSVEYNKLPYGTMLFEVQAQSTAGKWNTPVRQVVFYSPTPFFKTPVFMVLCVVLITIMIWAFVHRRIRVIQKRASDRENLYRKASEMELKFLTGQMNPHFTFNAMNSIQHFMLENDLLKAQNYLTKYSKLIRKVLENNMEKYVVLTAELDLLRLYVEIESMRFSRKVDLLITCEEYLLSYEIPPMLIQPYIENALWHGLFDHSLNSGCIELIMEEDTGALKCTITDNGIGRSRARAKQTQNDKSQSLGMLITRKRLDHLSDTNLKAPEIIDLFDENGNAAGTKVILYIPFNRK